MDAFVAGCDLVREVLRRKPNATLAEVKAELKDRKLITIHMFNVVKSEIMFARRKPKKRKIQVNSPKATERATASRPRVFTVTSTDSVKANTAAVNTGESIDKTIKTIRNVRQVADKVGGLSSLRDIVEELLVV